MTRKSRPNKRINIDNKVDETLPIKATELDTNIYGVFINLDEVFNNDFQPELITGNLNKEQLTELYKYINRLYDETGFSKEAYDDIILALDRAYNQLK